nr:MAG TPA: hypothetical protein [Caudoviricetes sp.]
MRIQSRALSFSMFRLSILICCFDFIFLPLKERKKGYPLPPLNK